MSELLQCYLLVQVEQRADCPAIVMDGEVVTDAECEQASNRLAQQLVALGYERDDRICRWSSSFAAPGCPAPTFSPARSIGRRPLPALFGALKGPRPR